MKVLKYNEFISETLMNPSNDDLKYFKQMDLNIKHKYLFDQLGRRYNIWWSLDNKSNDFLVKMYTGRYAIDLGGFGPSYNDIWMKATGELNGDDIIGANLLIKAIGDDKIPSEIIKDASLIVRKNSYKIVDDEEISLSKIDYVDIIFCGKDYVNNYQNNEYYVKITPGNISIQ